MRPVRGQRVDLVGGHENRPGPVRDEQGREDQATTAQAGDQEQHDPGHRPGGEDLPEPDLTEPQPIDVDADELQPQNRQPRPGRPGRSAPVSRAGTSPANQRGAAWPRVNSSGRNSGAEPARATTKPHRSTSPWADVTSPRPLNCQHRPDVPCSRRSDHDPAAHACVGQQTDSTWVPAVVTVDGLAARPREHVDDADIPKGRGSGDPGGERLGFAVRRSAAPRSTGPPPRPPKCSRVAVIPVPADSAGLRVIGITTVVSPAGCPRPPLVDGSSATPARRPSMDARRRIRHPAVSHPGARREARLVFRPGAPGSLVGSCTADDAQPQCEGPCPVATTRTRRCSRPARGPRTAASPRSCGRKRSAARCCCWPPSSR